MANQIYELFTADEDKLGLGEVTMRTHAYPNDNYYSIGYGPKTIMMSVDQIKHLYGLVMSIENMKEKMNG